MVEADGARFTRVEFTRFKAFKKFSLTLRHFNILVGPNNAGKSTVLLQSSYNYHERGMRTLLFTPAIDNRAGAGKVKSRIGLEAEALALQADEDVFAHVKAAHAAQPVACVLVDEAQFLTRPQVEQLTDVADLLNIPVLCYGLRTDFQAQLFPGSAALAPNGQCACGSDTYRLIGP